MVGGMAALVGAKLVGPRGTATFENYENKQDIPGHSMPLVALVKAINIVASPNVALVKELNGKIPSITVPSFGIKKNSPCPRVR